MHGKKYRKRIPKKKIAQDPWQRCCDKRKKEGVRKWDSVRSREENNYNEELVMILVGIKNEIKREESALKEKLKKQKKTQNKTCLGKNNPGHEGCSQRNSSDPEVDL